MCSRPTLCRREKYVRVTRDFSHYLELTIEYSSKSTEIENWCNQTAYIIFVLNPNLFSFPIPLGVVGGGDVDIDKFI